MIDVCWLVTGIAFGLSLGLWCGQMLLGLFVYWSTIDIGIRSFKSAVMFLFGAGGGASLLLGFGGSPGIVGYLIGGAIGMLIGRMIRMPDLRSETELEERALLASRLPEDLKDKSLLIDLFTEPARRIRHDQGIDSESLETRFVEALDEIAKRLDANDANRNRQ